MNHISLMSCAKLYLYLLYSIIVYFILFKFWILPFTCFQLISSPLCSVGVAATAAAIALLRVLVVLPSRPSPSSPLLLLVASAAYAQLWVPMRRPSPSGCSCSAACASSDCAALAVDDVLLGAYSRNLFPSHFLPPCPYLFTLRRLKRFFRLMKTKSKTVSVYSIFRPVRLSALLVLSLSLSLPLILTQLFAYFHIVLLDATGG